MILLKKIKIVCGDAIKLLERVKPNSIHLVLSDIPYGIALDEWDVLHANTNSALLGKSPAQEGKNAFKRRGKPINGWSSADRAFQRISRLVLFLGRISYILW